MHTVREKGVVEGDLARPEGATRVEIVPEQLAVAASTVFDVHGHVHEVAHLAHGRVHVDDAPVEEADRPVVEEQVADVGVAVDDRLRSLGEKRVEILAVMDVDLGYGREVVGQPITMVVEAVLQHHRAIRASEHGLGHPRRFGRAHRRVFVSGVDLGEAHERGRCAVGVDAPGAVADRAPGRNEILHQQNEAVVGLVMDGHVDLGHPKLQHRCEVTVEAHLAWTHARVRDRRSPVIDG